MKTIIKLNDLKKYISENNLNVVANKKCPNKKRECILIKDNGNIVDEIYRIKNNLYVELSM